MSDDPFGAEAVRRRVLAAWAASPARFREDANAEEDLALGGYRDRVVVELAQNAADAAAAAGVEGRLLLGLRGGALVAANTGAPLDASGVEALSTLRASAKRDDAAAVGRFGVGFSAVLAVTDSPCIDSPTGSVRWSLEDARGAVAAIPALADELARRGGHVPALRLPFAAPPEPPPAGYDTAVTLPLRDDDAAELVRRQLAEVADPLLLALPALASVTVEVDGTSRTFSDADERWHVVRRSGRIPVDLLADRPTEERSRRQWSLAWALPRDPVQVPGVVHAPTPTDEPLALPALLLASLPLDPSRRHVATGPLTDFLVERAAEAYAELVQKAPDPSLVPGAAPAGPLDAALRRAIVVRLAETPFLPAADDPAGLRLRPRDAVVVDGAPDELVAVLSDVLPGLVSPSWRGFRGLDGLGVRRLHLADVVDALADLSREPSWWRRLYDALQGADRDALGALPVPLADGRLARGPRGLLLPGDDLGGVDLPSAHLEALGLRVVHPEAAAPLLERLGATPVSARAVLEDPAVAGAADAAWDADDDTRAAVTDAVLSLVRAASPAPGEIAWLGDLPLVDQYGEPATARDLVLPDTPLARLAEDPLVPHPELVGRWGDAVLAAVGVAADFALERDADVVLDDDCDHDLDDEDGWVDAVRSGDGWERGTSDLTSARGGSRDALPAAELPPVLPELVAVRDLDLLRADAWGEVLSVLAHDPALRAATVDRARVVLPDGGARDVPSYTAWWLRRHARIDGQPLPDLRLAGADDALADLYDEVRLDVDGDFLRAVGIRTGVETLLAERDGPDDLLSRLADAERDVAPQRLRKLYGALASVDPGRVTPPDHVRVAAAGRTRVVPADDVEVVDAPQWLQLPAGRARLVVPLRHAADLADLLDLPVSSERAAAVVDDGVPAPVPRRVLDVLGEAAPETWLEHDRLTVDGCDVSWWVDGAGVHAATLDGLARGLAWAAGDWGRRHLAAAVLAEPQRADALLTEAELD